MQAAFTDINIAEDSSVYCWLGSMGESGSATMAQLQKLPEAHTDFIISLHWDGSVWALALVAVGAVAAVIAVVLYRRRRRNNH